MIRRRALVIVHILFTLSTGAVATWEVASGLPAYIWANHYAMMLFGVVLGADKYKSLWSRKPPPTD